MMTPSPPLLNNTLLDGGGGGPPEYFYYFGFPLTILIFSLGIALVFFSCRTFFGYCGGNGTMSICCFGRGGSDHNNQQIVPVTTTVANAATVLIRAPPLTDIHPLELPIGATANDSSPQFLEPTPRGGATAGSSVTTIPSPMNRDKKCCVCTINTCRVAIVPCGHVALCLRKRCILMVKDCCPICRCTISKFITLFPT